MTLADTRSHVPIPRTVKVVKPKRRINPMSKRRKSASRLYNEVTKPEHLAEHPWCQIYMIRRQINESVVKANNGAYPIVTPGGIVHWKLVPLATQIHHTRKPKCKYLNDRDSMLSACFEEHEWVEHNLGLARQLGLLHNN